MAVSRERKLWPLAAPRGFIFTIFATWQTPAKFSDILYVPLSLTFPAKYLLILGVSLHW